MSGGNPAAPEPIAIVGVAGVFPHREGWSDEAGLWQTILRGEDAAREAPEGRWTLDVDRAYRAGGPHPDRVASRRACFVDGFTPDLAGLDVDPAAVAALDPLVGLVLHAGGRAFAAAQSEGVDRDRVGVILGNIALPTAANGALAEAMLGSRFERELFARAGRPRPNLPGTPAPDPLDRWVVGLPAGILARALGLGGAHFCLDAACASSLFAVHLAVARLRERRADMVLCGGVARPDAQYTQMGFSQLRALSPSGRCRSFDAGADGLVVGEGVGVFALKRLSDALRDGDRVHALVRGTGLSNDQDGRLLAPSEEGQLRAMRAAYREAGWAPQSVDLVECHATGTPVGDAVELGSLRRLWAEHTGTGRAERCAIGSVKSNVGHLLTGAGAAGIAKVLGAFEHATLPPSANVERSIVDASDPFEVLDEARPWASRREAGKELPRRAAVSGFGFGGTNAHVLLEEFGEAARDASVRAVQVSVPASKRSVAIVGLGAWTGAWRGREAATARLLGGSEERALSECSSYGETDLPKGNFIESVELPMGRFRIPPRELERSLPQQLVALDVAWEASEDAGLREVEPRRVGVFVGLAQDPVPSTYRVRWWIRARAPVWARALGRPEQGAEYERWVDGLCDAVSPALDAERTMGGLGGIVASRIGRELGAGGPTYVIGAEECSGNAALEVAAGALARKEIDAALVVGVDLLGDPRNLVPIDALRRFAHEGPARPGDERAAGSVPADGAVALVLKRSDDVGQGDRVYAHVRGMASATGGAPLDPRADVSAGRRAVAAALEEAEADAQSVELLELHGEALANEDRLELAAVRRYATARRTCAKAEVGHLGAASGLLGVAKAALALHHGVLPGAPQVTNARADLGPSFERPWAWLPPREGTPRRAAVDAMSTSGLFAHAILEAPALATSEAEDPLGLLRELPLPLEVERADEWSTRLADLEARLDSGEAFASIAQHCQDTRRPEAPHALVLVARDVSTLRDAIEQARQRLAGDASRPGTTRAYICAEPLGRTGEVAFVYPGSGSQYPGMGRGLTLAWPSVWRAQASTWPSLRAQVRPEVVWDPQAPGLHDDARALILAQVTHGTLATDVLAGFGVRPDAIIGYSLGETAGLFSIGAWHEREEMLQRVEQTPLFADELCGRNLAARRAWGLLEDDPEVSWQIAVVDRPAARVREALEEIPRAYLLIVNTPDECVVGGDEKALEALRATLGCSFHPLYGITTVHCDVARSLAEPYRDLHLLDTRAREGIRVYSGSWGEAYPLGRERAADSILANALHGVDYPKTIESAWADGVRVFVEMGPGASCTRMIHRILGEERPHVALALGGAAHDEADAVVHALAQLVAHRVEVDIRSLFTEASAAPTGLRVEVPVQAAASWPVLADSLVEAPAEVAQNLAAPIAVADEAAALPAVAAALLRMADARAQAHAHFLAISAQRRELMQALVAGGAPSTPPPASRHEAPTRGRARPALRLVAAPAGPPENPAAGLSREQCLTFAVGKIGEVFGETFAEVDANPTRVRLPDEPLMLVDRVLKIEGEPRSMSSGRIVTEHDVLEGAWYLDGDRIPTCVAVEAGQADLMLCGWLGIDFETGGHAVYRLLDAVVTFHDALPRPGQTIHYDIAIERFIRQGDTWLFRFRFDATVDGRPLLTMREGCAGFFSQAELDAGKGIIRSRLAAAPKPGLAPEGYEPFQAVGPGASMDEAAVDALREGDLERAFGPAFADIGLAKPAVLPSGHMRLVDRVLDMDSSGGRWGLGRIRAEFDIHPDDWFITCHFVDDMVMPGTLMYECCLHTLRILLMRMGWVGESDALACEPIPGVKSRLRCRGQVLDDTKVVEYDIEIKEVRWAPEPAVIVDALMIADGKPVVEIGDMSLRMSGLSVEELRERWAGRAPERGPARLPAVYDYAKILAFSDGNPSEAFGPPYRPFDAERRIARLPRPPYQFLDRIVDVSGDPFVMKAGATCRAQVDVDPSQWYFAANRQPDVSFAVLLEMVLQPCGWLAAYVGSALTSDTDLRFRNLGGEATRLGAVTCADDVLTTDVELTAVSSSGGMIIQHYAYRMVGREAGPVYEGTTYFGFFSAEALANQVGIREQSPRAPTPGERARGESFSLPSEAPFPEQRMRMVDHVDLFVPDGGDAGLGFIVGSIDVDASRWFFEAHFRDDPVWPGSLGLEAFLQLVQVVAQRRFGAAAKARFVTVPEGGRHKWTYRGQVIPGDRRVEVQASITAVDEATRTLRADGWLSVDGRAIYQMHDFEVRVESEGEGEA